MSRPKAWNGTQWVDPQFHIGDNQFKTYIPATYSVPVSQYEFAGGTDGWVNRSDGPPIQWSGSEGGFIFCDTGQNGGADDSLASVRMGDAGYYGNYPPDASRPLNPAQQVRQQVVWRAIPFGGTYPPDYPFKMLFGFTWDGGWWAPSHEEYSPDYAQGVDTGWQTFTSGLVTPGQYLGYLTQWVEPGEGYMDNYGDWRIQIASARLIDQNGNPIMALSDPGWEPRVKRADGSWK